MPLVDFGYATPICGQWVCGLSAHWKYLGYKTPNVDANLGQHIPNATFSSINFFGPNVLRDFTSLTRLNQEFLSLVFGGMRLQNGYVYFGVGPLFFASSNSIYVSSVHIPNGIGDFLISASSTDHKTSWGVATQLGYNYYLGATCFLSMSYTYAQTRKIHYNNTVNAAQLNGENIPGPTNLYLDRSIGFSSQEILISINKVF